MYAGRGACCPLVSHIEHAPRALLSSGKRRDRVTYGRTDRQTPDITLPLDAASVMIANIDSKEQIPFMDNTEVQTRTADFSSSNELLL